MIAQEERKSYWGPNALAEIETAYQSIDPEKNDLLLKYTRFQFSTNKGQEYAHHGFLHRVGILNQCIHNIFLITPPDQIDRISTKQSNDLSINLQAFVANVFGCLDNIAWIWVHHNEIEIEKTQVGLKPKHKKLRDSLPTEFQKILESSDNWFEYIEGYRDALAHRIPLYVLPFSLNPTELELYNQLENQKWEALLARDIGKCDDIDGQQDLLGRFYPWMQHSFSETKAPMAYHGQILSDWKTIIHLGKNFLTALEESKVQT